LIARFRILLGDVLEELSRSTVLTACHEVVRGTIERVGRISLQCAGRRAIDHVNRRSRRGLLRRNRSERRSKTEQRDKLSHYCFLIRDWKRRCPGIARSSASEMRERTKPFGLESASTIAASPRTPTAESAL